jgi:serine/threonine protein kinase
MTVYDQYVVSDATSPFSHVTTRRLSLDQQNHDAAYVFTVVGIAVGLSIFLLMVYVAVCYLFRVEQHKKKYEHLPLHRAVVDGTPLTQAFFDEHLHSAVMRDSDGSSVIDLILARMPNYIISKENWYELIVHSLPFDIKSGEPLPPNRHNYAWSKIVQRDEQVIVEVVRMITEKAADRVKKLLYSLDGNQRQSIDIASPKCKDVLSRTLFLHGCYELREGPPEYQSDSTLIRIATYHAPTAESLRSNVLKPRVVLKFMRDRWQMLKETGTRELLKESDLLPIKAVFDGDRKENLEETVKHGFGAYPHCIVLDVADANLRLYSEQKRSAVVNWDDIRRIMKTLLTIVSQMHKENVIHGDIKPANIVLLGHRIYLIDLDACVIFREECPQFVGGKYSSAYTPPEFVHKRFGSTVLKVYRGDQLNHKFEASGRHPGVVLVSEGRKYDYQYLAAHPSFDMWSLGCVFYYLCTGNSLFPTTMGDNTTAKELMVLANWNNAVKEEKLRGLSDDLATNLLSLLLDADPIRRITASNALDHPFITNVKRRSLTRQLRARPEYDIFLSYRASIQSDARIAFAIHEQLSQRGMKVWISDKVTDDEMCTELFSSSCYVCLLSRLAINNSDVDELNFSRLEVSSPCDDILLTWRLALELKERDVIDGIYPVLIGDHMSSEEPDSTGLERATITYSGYFKSGCHPSPLPDRQVEAVEKKLRDILEKHSFGLPLDRQATVSKTVKKITDNQGGFIQGDPEKALKYVVDEIIAMREKLQLEEEVKNQDRQSPRAVVKLTNFAVETLGDDVNTEEEEVVPSSISKLSARLSSIKDEQASRRLSMSSKGKSSKLLKSPKEDQEKLDLIERVQNLSDLLFERGEELKRLQLRYDRYQEMLLSTNLQGPVVTSSASPVGSSAARYGFDLAPKFKTAALKALRQSRSNTGRNSAPIRNSFKKNSVSVDTTVAGAEATETVSQTPVNQKQPSYHRTDPCSNNEEFDNISMFYDMVGGGDAKLPQGGLDALLTSPNEVIGVNPE